MTVLEASERPWRKSPDSERAPATMATLILCAGVIGVLILAATVTLYTKLGDLQAALVAKTSAEELARTRYEAEIRMLDEVSKKVDLLNAWYQDDVRTGVTSTKTKRR